VYVSRLSAFVRYRESFPQLFALKKIGIPFRTNKDVCMRATIAAFTTMLMLVADVSWPVSQATLCDDHSASSPVVCSHVRLPLVLADTRTSATSTHTATATATSTHTATATATSTHTATATATTAATTTASVSASPTPTGTTPLVQCYAQTFIYPMGVSDQLLGPTGFVPPDIAELPYYLPYSDDVYTDTYQRRVYLQYSFDETGGLIWLRWNQGIGSTGAHAWNHSQVVADMSGDGTVDDLFEESAWGVRTDVRPEPPGYPLIPGDLSAGDWVHGGRPGQLSPQLEQALTHLRDTRTILALPVLDAGSGIGIDSAFHVARLGNFLLRSWGRQNGRFYVDLVAVGDTPALPCPTSP
jgi:hypothetical protein